MRRLMINLVAVLVISVGALYLGSSSEAKANSNTSVLVLSDCKATLGADCNCDPGQTCEAGLFKCECTGGDEEVEPE